MLIGELSKKSGLTRDTIRFYEKQGLIFVAKKDRRSNNYKEYAETTLERLMMIRRIKFFGFTLNETASFLEMIETNDASCRNVSERVEGKIQLIDQKIRELLELKRNLLAFVDSCPSGSNPEFFDEACPAITPK